MTGEKICVCGHPEAVHRHFRRGSDCGSCGAQKCPRFRRDKQASQPAETGQTTLPAPGNGRR
ncbi:hypothetical protein GCM10022222_01780 [Amycolatopsis ultiminotia]|uniref:Metallothionein n=1 Tax=Amycolatopsis ultiminotia TaxID=543629 RepID=A0ABP6UYR0_9PSEU